jgi:hypothetical protein
MTHDTRLNSHVSYVANHATPADTPPEVRATDGPNLGRRRWGRPLTDREIRGAKATGKGYRLLDERGLHLFVTAKGAKSWRLRIYVNGVEQSPLTLGLYPAVSARLARRRRDKALGLIEEGKDPRAALSEEVEGQGEKVGRQFETVAREWWAARKESERWDEDYALQVMSQLERDVFPIKIARGLERDVRDAHPLLSLPVGEWSFDAVKPPDVLEICKNVEARGSLDAARDLRSRISMIYQREIALGRCSVDPTGSVVALLAKPRRTNHATITYAQLPDLFCRLDAEPLVATTSLGLEAIIATWLRSTELRLAFWVWLNWEARELVIPSKTMKNGDLGQGDHVVPLSDYAMDVFGRLYVVTGHGELMFPHRSEPGEPISDGTWLNALYRMGYRNKATVHGIRALGSTTANEAHVTVPNVPVPVKMWEPRWIDRQLDHVDGTVSGVYNRAEYMEPRRALMHWWGQRVQEARAVSKTLPPPPPKERKPRKAPEWSVDT